jgi:glutamyl/glutaminyl-tRNA synthetase
VQQVNGDFKLFAKLLKDRTGRKGADLFMPLRLALTGQTHGPELAPLFKLMTLETARRRLQAAQKLC